MITIAIKMQGYYCKPKPPKSPKSPKSPKPPNFTLTNTYK
jgi:hypothetical protein